MAFRGDNSAPFIIFFVAGHDMSEGIARKPSRIETEYKPWDLAHDRRDIIISCTWGGWPPFDVFSPLFLLLFKRPNDRPGDRLDSVFSIGVVMGVNEV